MDYCVNGSRLVSPLKKWRSPMESRQYYYYYYYLLKKRVSSFVVRRMLIVCPDLIITGYWKYFCLLLSNLIVAVYTLFIFVILGTFLLIKELIIVNKNLSHAMKLECKWKLEKVCIQEKKLFWLICTWNWILSICRSTQWDKKNDSILSV